MILRKTALSFGLQKQLRNTILSKKCNSSTTIDKPIPESFDSFLVLDFEATCDHGSNNFDRDYQEIIEFPVLKVDGKSLQVVDQFHSYVRPVINPKLSPYCTRLTGITQDTVDASQPFPEVLEAFDEWFKAKVDQEQRYAFVTQGEWDLETMLPLQCKLSNVKRPEYFNRWINLSYLVWPLYGKLRKSFKALMKTVNIEPIGKHHSGIDDCINIARALAVTGKDFPNSFAITSSLVEKDGKLTFVEEC